MEIVFDIVTVAQSFAVSLGVGASTLALASFFVAIADGAIDETERRMLGVVYIVLRVAMVIILLATLILSFITYQAVGELVISPHAAALWTLLSVLYVNAILMTLQKVPTTVGPAIQAATWYTLGTIMAVLSLDLSYSYGQFFLCFVTAVVFAVAFTNSLMAWLKACRNT